MHPKNAAQPQQCEEGFMFNLSPSYSHCVCVCVCVSISVPRTAIVIIMHVSLDIFPSFLLLPA